MTKAKTFSLCSQGNRRRNSIFCDFVMRNKVNSLRKVLRLLTPSYSSNICLSTKVIEFLNSNNKLFTMRLHCSLVFFCQFLCLEM